MNYHVVHLCFSKIPHIELRTWQFIGRHCCSYPNDAKWCSVACVERQCVEEGFSDKGRLLMVGNSAGLPSGREGVHILIDNWLEFYETSHSEDLSAICFHLWPHMEYLSFEILWKAGKRDRSVGMQWSPVNRMVLGWEGVKSGHIWRRTASPPS